MQQKYAIQKSKKTESGAAAMHVAAFNGLAWTHSREEASSACLALKMTSADRHGFNFEVVLI